MFQASSARRAFWAAVSAVNGGSGGRLIVISSTNPQKDDRDRYAHQIEAEAVGFDPKQDSIKMFHDTLA